MSYVSLYKAMGGGWIITAEGMTTTQAHAGDTQQTPDAAKQDVK
ncbi:hypothetical protein PSAB6_440001 [Paraburkholderia sabiae]|nr:hypothetical protein PSAB6_440001 [Paraburkholderia sabiae]